MKGKEEIIWFVERVLRNVIIFSNINCIVEFGEVVIMMSLYMNEIYGNNNSNYK